MSTDLDFFTLLGLPRRLSVPKEDLEKRFYELSRQWHPDRFARRSPQEQQHALDTSSALNDAHRILKDPLRRADYILKLEGIHAGDQRSNEVPPELLEQVFEWNMAMEELRDGDASARSQVLQMAAGFRDLLSQSDSELQTLFEKYDANPGREALLPIRALLNRRKYIENLVAQAPN